MIKLYKTFLPIIICITYHTVHIDEKNTLEIHICTDVKGVSYVNVLTSFVFTFHPCFFAYDMSINNYLMKKGKTKKLGRKV